MTRRTVSGNVTIACALLLASSSSLAQARVQKERQTPAQAPAKKSTALPAQSPAQEPANSAGIVTTLHSVVVNGKALKYVARAGLIPIRDNEAGDVHGHMFFVSYTVERASGQRARPLTFLWNGGPGSNAGLVHLLGFGPKRVAAAQSASSQSTATGTTFIDNDGTWLDHSDLVFVDPIGTGYSRPAKPEYGTEFYQSRGDAESVAEFIRVYRTRYDAFDAPLFIMGESYGVTRASLAADALERRGTSLAGVIMLGLALPLGDVPAPSRIALGVPTFTAAAFANRKLPADLQKDLSVALRAAERWAGTEYLQAMTRRDSLTVLERDALAAQLARFTGIPAQQIDRKELRITMEQMSNTLLASDNRVVGHYDSRLTGPRDTAQQMYDPTRDPSLKDILDGPSVIRYLRGELGYKSDLFYQGPFGGGYPPPTTFRGDWMSTRWNRTTPVNATALRTAMTANQKMEVFIACGYYDLVCDYFGNEHAVLRLPSEFSGRVFAHSYGGGHAVYTDDHARLELRRDVTAFIDRLAAAREQP